MKKPILALIAMSVFLTACNKGGPSENDVANAYRDSYRSNVAALVQQVEGNPEALMLLSNELPEIDTVSLHECNPGNVEKTWFCRSTLTYRFKNGSSKQENAEGIFYQDNGKWNVFSGNK